MKYQKDPTTTYAQYFFVFVFFTVGVVGGLLSDYLQVLLSIAILMSISNECMAQRLIKTYRELVKKQGEHLALAHKYNKQLEDKQ